jgi:hypothetical protein
MAPRILIATTVRWPTAARVAAAFGELGAEVEALYPEGSPLAASGAVTGRYRYQAMWALRALRLAIERSEPDLIVPCDDRAVRQLVALHRSAGGWVASAIERSLGAVENYAQLMSRSASLAAACEEGIRVADTLPVADEEQLDEALSELGLPAVLKLDGSWGGDGVTTVHTREEARQVFRRLAAAPSVVRSLARSVHRCDVHFLRAGLASEKPVLSLQRFVRGRQATSTLACWQGEVIAASHFDVVVTWGATGPATVIQRVACPEMSEAARRVAARFGLSGLHGLDFIRDEEGRRHLIEINPRATQTSHLALGPATDLPAALLGAVGAVRPRLTVTSSDLIALFPKERQRDPQSPYLKAAYHDMPWNDLKVLARLLGPGAQTPAWQSGSFTRAPLPLLTGGLPLGRATFR